MSQHYFITHCHLPHYHSSPIGTGSQEDKVPSPSSIRIYDVTPGETSAGISHPSPLHSFPCSPTDSIPGGCGKGDPGLSSLISPHSASGGGDGRYWDSSPLPSTLAEWGFQAKKGKCCHIHSLQCQLVDYCCYSRKNRFLPLALVQ